MTATSLLHQDTFLFCVLKRFSQYIQNLMHTILNNKKRAKDTYINK